MLLGIKSRKILLIRHIFTGLIALLLVYIFWLSKKNLAFDARIWRALGDTAFIFLFITLLIGPLAKLWEPAWRLITWRRETGIWFAILSFSHFLKVFNFSLQEPGIELPRLLGLIALFWTLILTITSSDRAVNFLGIWSWKWLHSMVYVIFYLVFAHATYFLFWRYPESNWFRFLFLSLAVTIPLLQISAFIKEVRRQKIGNASIPNKKLILPILKQKIIADETYEISFSLLNKKFEFFAGQHIWVTVPKLLFPDPKGNARVFSIVSSPNDKEKLVIAFRNSGSGFKKTLIKIPIGSQVEIEGPYGYFTLPKDNSEPLVFIAGGIGITPFLSMIRFVNENKLKYSIILLYTNRNKDSAAYLQELKNISKQNPHFQLKNKFGRLDEDFIRESVGNILYQVKWYIVGPPPMVAAAKEILNNISVSPDHIFFEEFIGY